MQSTRRALMALATLARARAVRPHTRLGELFHRMPTDVIVHSPLIRPSLNVQTGPMGESGDRDSA
jgi:hypothetical protein